MTIDEFEEYAKSHNILIMTREFYENRLKADLKAIFVELQLEIEEYKSDRLVDMERDEMARIFSELIQKKINSLKAESEVDNG